VQRTQGRIVQSPDRIKKRISQMTLDAAEEKRNITANETKARELQAKVNALVIIEKVCFLVFLGRPLNKTSGYAELHRAASHGYEGGSLIAGYFTVSK